MSNRFAGVTYDWYDDQGLTLKSKFPTRESLPDIIKTATVHPKEGLANEQFALVMIDNGGVFRKYACNDAGTTAMSAVYFMEHGDKLPEEAQKLAASNLIQACLRHGIRPPAPMVKVARTALVKRLLGGLLPQTSKAMPELAQAAKRTQMAGKMMGSTERAVQKLGPQAVLNPATAAKVDKTTQMARNIGTKAKQEMRQMTGALQNPAAGAGARNLQARQAFRKEVMEAPKVAVASANLVDITGLRPPTKVKVAAPESDNDYAVITSDGRRLYPIHTWDMMKTAESYWQENRRLMEPEIRRQFATKLAAKAEFVGFPLDLDIVEAGAQTYGTDGHLGAAIEMRKVACAPGSDDRDFLDGLFEKRAEIEPGVYAEVLRRFDVENGLDSGWDHVVLDPWVSTFGINKTAEVIWQSGADRVTDRAITNLAENHLDIVQEEFTEHMADEFKKDPISIFKSMPEPNKKILARMACDSESLGGSEASFTR